ncbi:hypothetical protein [Cryptosporangium phraense]|uniref:Uncharacterized protein n=1 Tax=Cryptosporangium phraense TaxID=2593070 RepID=A0A545AXZ1_9ACTN|nr:hypothetical protein [Cryptosporangium phraense]TQS46168.1 hypothetical protein FL583_06725 [Cryptosporangium phraense]
MNDIKRLLAAALNEEHTPMTTDVRPTDPTADLDRGRHHLYRRRAAIAGGVAVAALLVGGAAAWVGTSSTSSTSNTPVTAQAPAKNQIQLVAYTGKQPKGYRVEQLPDGWVIQGGSESSLTIAPRSAADKDPDSFVNKLTVLSASSDTPKGELTQGTPVPTGDRTGYLRSTDGIQIFTYQDKSGRWVQIQVPAQLHWDGARIAEFATGITVVNGAGDAHG